MFLKRAAFAAGAAMAVASASPAAATAVISHSFNTSSVGANKGTMGWTIGAFNNSLALMPYFQSLTTGGMSFRAYAFTTASLTAMPTPASIQVFDGGLGVLNGAEGNGSGNQHTVDNVGQYDFVLFQFDRGVRLTGMTLNAYGVNGAADKDAWVSYVNVDGNILTQSQAANEANWKTLLGRSMDSANGGMPDTTGMYANVWVIGAARVANSRLGIDVGNDGFKIAAITASVPEPATWATMMLGFGLAGASIRRRRSRVAFAAA